MTDSTIHDVVIAGAGPVGLFLACELRLFGVSVLVLEQAEDSRSPLKRLPFGMRGLSIPSVEAFYRRGMLDEIAAPPAAATSGTPAPAAHWQNQQRRPGGHFAGIQFFLDDVDADRWPYRLPNPAGEGLAVTMEHLETVLAERAKAMGVEIRSGRGVDGFEQIESGVTVRAGASGSAETIRARWLIGCDGGRSVVRKAGGFEFVGTDPEFTGYSVELEMADPELLAPGRHYTPTGMFMYQKPGTIAMADFDGGAFHRSEPTLAHVQSVLRRVSGKDVELTALKLASTWTDRAFQATSYRNGRVLLAGDAAHIHSPLGGQGLNLGVGDAMNLGWKLASTIRGDAPAGLLDTYFTERHPIGAQILDWSRAQVGIMRPARSSRALESILRDLIATRDGATYFAERVWGANLRYDLGGAHPLVGRSAPDFELADGSRLATHLNSGRGILLDFSQDSRFSEPWNRWRDQIPYLASQPKDRLALDALLVRPDGVVAWGTGTGIASNQQELVQAAMRWFSKA